MTATVPPLVADRMPSRLEGVMAKKHTVELKANVNSAQFQAGGKLVTLDKDKSSYDAANENEYADLLAQHPFLKASAKQEG
jgi:hypothetical protein